MASHSRTCSLFCSRCFCFLVFLTVQLVANTSVRGSELQWDSRGYILYCPCMGRFGNQADHFLGALQFAKGLDRTLVLPPWIQYRHGKPPYTNLHVPFKDWFQVEPLQEYHRVLPMEDFMEQLAPEHWPPERRKSFCFTMAAQRSKDKKSCPAKEGNPFGPFWDNFDVDFVSSELYEGLSYNTEDRGMVDKWNKRFPPDQFPVLAFMGAPANFPVLPQNIDLHRYVHWSDKMMAEVNQVIEKNLPRPFVGVHLRNGMDWKSACEHVDGSRPHLFASGQCVGYDHRTAKTLTKEMCFPSKKEVLKAVRKAVKKVKAKSIYVATDNDPMLPDLRKEFDQLSVFHLNPEVPQLDLAILGQADHFVGNCVSTFTAFVTRERKAADKPTTFFANKNKKKKDEL
ncbi:Hypp1248 [Branchiostoma lanceolatum]|uniref:GDP-fucose protein O-fucosyltransferase 1 n=1 Tax=Branchiostoma lanceolatum TaxID=7740 RepID=A0A8J9ZFR6_BRALA|nr:Hypp1248 [Branchiostoma lanceolatum]